MTTMYFVGEAFEVSRNTPAARDWANCLAAESTCALTVARRELKAGATTRATADLWKRSLGLAVRSERPDSLVFLLGQADTAYLENQRAVPLHESISAMRGLLLDALEVAPTLLIGPPPVADPLQNSLIEELSAAYETLTATLAVGYCPLYWKLASTDDWALDIAESSQGHVTNLGHARIAQTIVGDHAWCAFVREVCNPRGSVRRQQPRWLVR